MIILRSVFLDEYFQWSSKIYAVTWILFSLRILQYFYLYPHIGPKIQMIKKMLRELLYFLLIFAVFLFSYGIAQRALLFPNSKESFSDVVFNIIHNPYYAVYQQFDKIQSQFENCSHNDALNKPNENLIRNARCSWLARLLFAIYAAITCLLLVNLLIAIFNTTFQNVQSEAEQTWSFNRVDIIIEYIGKPFLPPPFILILHFVRMCKNLRKFCERNRGSNCNHIIDSIWAPIIDIPMRQELQELMDTKEAEGRNEYMNPKSRQSEELQRRGLGEAVGGN